MKNSFLKTLTHLTTRKNHVAIFNRWGDVVFEVDDYNNDDHVFTGTNKNGKDLPSGTYL